MKKKYISITFIIAIAKNTKFIFVQKRLTYSLKVIYPTYMIDDLINYIPDAPAYK